MTERAEPPSARGRTISCAVMSHPLRRGDAERLRTRLIRGGLGAGVVSDPRPPGSVPATLPTAIAAWSAMPPSATHHLVLQDDVQLCDGFVERLCAATAALDEPACLFSEWGSTTATTVRWAALSGYAAAQCVDTYTPTQGVLMSRDDVDGFLRFAAGRAWSDPDDVVLRAYLGDAGRSAFVLTPNLLDHDVRGDSIMLNERMGRRRATLLPADGRPVGDGLLAFDGWVPVCTWSKGRAVCLRYDATSPDPVDAIPTRRLLRRLGQDPGAISGAVARMLDRAGGPVDLELRVGFALLHEVYLTAAALALLAPAEPAAGSEIVRYALNTLAPGALRTFVGPDVLDAAAHQLTDFVMAGFEDGLRMRGDMRV